MFGLLLAPGELCSFGSVVREGRWSVCIVYSTLLLAHRRVRAGCTTAVAVLGVGPEGPWPLLKSD